MKNFDFSLLCKATVVAAITLACSSLSVEAQLINVQFAQGQAPVSPVYTGQGVIMGGNFWNELQVPPGNGFSNVTLSDGSGTATTVTLSTNSLGYYGQQNTLDGTKPDALLQNYVLRSTYNGNPTPEQQANTTITLTLNGLADSTAYNLVVYNAGNPTNYSLNGGPSQTITTTGVSYNANAMFIDGVSYTELTGVSTSTGVLTLTTSITGSENEADISGLQLQVASVPEPSSYAMIFCGAGLLVATSRFLKSLAV